MWMLPEVFRDMGSFHITDLAYLSSSLRFNIAAWIPALTSAFQVAELKKKKFEKNVQPLKTSLNLLLIQLTVQN